MSCGLSGLFQSGKVFCGQTSPNCTFFVGNHGRCVLRAKKKGVLPACYQRSAQKTATLMVWGCISAYGMGSLQCCSPSDEMLNQGPDSLWLLKITGCLSKRVEV